MNNINHIAIIMDGNGRYAKEKGLLRTFGHKKGVENVRKIALFSNKKGIKVLTLYAFSTENWKRPLEEVNYIMSLPKFFFDSYLKELMENNIKVMMIGDINKIPEEAKNIFLEAIEKTKNNTGMILNFALNYGSRQEIVKAIKNYCQDVIDGRENNLSEEEFNNYLDTKDLPEVDILIRTSGEQRISNFLLYQISYSELIFTNVHWPDFNEEEFDKCLHEYQNRHRRYGGI